MDQGCWNGGEETGADLSFNLERGYAGIGRELDVGVEDMGEIRDPPGSRLQQLCS